MSTIQRSLLTRQQAALATRVDAARIARARGQVADHQDNGGETGGPGGAAHLLHPPEPEVPSYIGNYSKGLPHFGLDSDRVGQVRPEAYGALLKALATQDPTDFENIPLGVEGSAEPQGGLKRRLLTSPQAGLAFDLEGPDAQSLTMPPAPRLDSVEGAGEMAELYWMALLRDAPFEAFATDYCQLVRDAVADLRQYPQFRQVTEQTLFRSDSPGSQAGPYLSQFLLIGNSAGTAPACQHEGRDALAGFITYGTQLIDQRSLVAEPGLDWLTDEEMWLKVQDGWDFSGEDCFLPKPRFLTTPRDVATYVHLDQLYQAYLNACLYMLAERRQLQGGKHSLERPEGEGEASFAAKLSAPTSLADTKPTLVNAFPFAEGIPYTRSRTQLGFATFGGPHILSLVTEVATRALKAVWYQKWFVHRRLRPEAFGGWVHLTKTREQRHGISPQLLHSQVLQRVQQHNADQNNRHGRPGADSYLLPQAFPEGSPTHPAYGAGHATVAAACTTILKAWFKDGPFPVPAVQVADNDGGSLTWLAQEAQLGMTIHGELNKLAANIAVARNLAGVHYLSDYTASRKLGEEIAIGILQEQAITYNENPLFSFVTFDGRERVIIRKNENASSEVRRLPVEHYGC